MESIRRAQFAEYLYAGHFRETWNSAVWKQGARCFSEVVPSLWWCLHTQAGGGGGSTICTSSAGNRLGPPAPAGVGGAFGRTPQLQGVPKKMINPRHAVISCATVAHKKNSANAAVGPHEAGGCAEDDRVLPPNHCQVCATATTVSNARPERRVRCATFSQRWHKWKDCIGLRIAAPNLA